MSKKVAIVISGAVSLGSYEAGVMYEVINAFKHHNERTPDSNDHFKIDVIVGTSAGAMTAAILARQLLFDGDNLNTKDSNSLYQIWVKKTRIEDLLKDGPGDDPNKSILSSSFIRSLGAEYLSAPHPGGELHIAAAPQIWLGMAMTNLNGVDYGIKTLSGHDFTYTHFEDQLIRAIDRGKPDGVNWDEIRDTAIASGAFPFAFAVCDILRHKADYDPPAPPATLQTPFPDGNAHFTFCDGGMFDNEPLGMAKNLVDKIDPNDDENRRYYLFVCPHSKNGDHMPLNKYNAETATLGSTPLRIINCIIANAAFQDWVTSEQINQDIDLLDERAADLANFIADGTVNLMPAKALLKSLTDQFLPNIKDQNDALAMLGKQYASEYGKITAANPDQAFLFLQQILVFQKAAKLLDKNKMWVIDITADETKELAGSGFHSFVGFCSEVIREHDFQVGRLKALQFIQSNRIGLNKDYTPNPADGNLSPDQPLPDISEAPMTIRQQFYDRLKQRIEVAIKDADVPWYVKSLSWVVAPIALSAMGVKKALKI